MVVAALVLALANAAMSGWNVKGRCFGFATFHALSSVGMFMAAYR
jgi:hypothetical protein